MCIMFACILKHEDILELNMSFNSLRSKETCYDFLEWMQEAARRAQNNKDVTMVVILNYTSPDIQYSISHTYNDNHAFVLKDISKQP